VLSRRSDERREARRRALQGKLLPAVEELLREGRSYAELSVEEIIRRAGVPRTTFYAYFGDKRELLLRLARLQEADLVDALSAWQPTGEDLGTALRDLLRAFLRRNQERPLLRTITEAAYYDATVRAAWLQEQDLIIARIEDFLRRERDAGRVPADLPLGAAASALHWMVQQTCFQEMVARRRLDEEDYLDAIVKLWTRGVRLAPGDGSY
jgi:TetR/AcrR family transcriptional regulator, ethionamide resistance regulator